MISVIINAWKEPDTIGKAIKSIGDSKYSGITPEFEIIQVSPDKETLEAGMQAAKELNLYGKFSQIKDPIKGKPYALKLAVKQARGDILILTDGDVYFGKNAVKALLRPFDNPKIGGSTGRPISLNLRSSMMGYFSHILTDSAHHRRASVFENKGEYLMSGKSFFPMSGYIIATRSNLVDLPANVLSDDAYISYDIRNKGYEISYVPDALVYVKFPTTLSDYLKQKVRSLGGYVQLKDMGIMKRDKQSRSFLIELRYTFFVLLYPRNIKEFIWSILLFPIRLYTWLLILYKRVIKKEGMPENGWERILSTK